MKEHQRDVRLKRITQLALSEQNIEKGYIKYYLIKQLRHRYYYTFQENIERL